MCTGSHNHCKKVKDCENKIMHISTKEIKMGMSISGLKPDASVSNLEKENRAWKGWKGRDLQN